MEILRKLFKREYISKICNFKELFGYIATWKYRNSHQSCSIKKGVLRNFAKFTGKSLCQIIFSIKLQVSGLRPATLLKKEVLAQVFPCEFCKIFKNTFFTEHVWATAFAHVMNLLLFLILESMNMIVLICCKNMTIIFSKSVTNSLFVQIVSYCIGKKHLKKYFIQQR